MVSESIESSLICDIIWCAIYVLVCFSKNINQRRDENITWVSKYFDPSTGLQSLAQHLFLNKITEYWLSSISVLSLKLFSLVFLMSMFHITGISVFLQQKSGYGIACKCNSEYFMNLFNFAPFCALSFSLPVYLHYYIFFATLYLSLISVIHS